MSDPTYDDLMKFVVDLLNYYDTTGIQDKFDNQTNKMMTSTGVYDLIKRARNLGPESLKGGAAAKKMEALPEEDRKKAIEGSDNVINLRNQFSKKVAENGAARGLLAAVVDAARNGQPDTLAMALDDAYKFTRAERGEETFGEKNDKV